MLLRVQQNNKEPQIDKISFYIKVFKKDLLKRVIYLLHHHKSLFPHQALNQCVDK